MSWSHFNPVRIKTGPGTSRSLGESLPDGPVLLLTTAGMERRNVIAPLLTGIASKNDWTIRFIESNPDLDVIDALAGQLRGENFRAIFALGGGSVMDAAKALSVLLIAKGDRMLHQSLRNGQPLYFTQTLPVICLPTTSGTGAEVTPFATIWDNENKQKYSLSDEALYPSLAILDPELTLTLPWQETLYGALDACSHALETLWNRHATPVSGAFALQSLHKILLNLPLVQANPMDLSARAQLQEASLLAGMAISQSRTALAHSISYPLTARFGVPHGLACSFTLPAIMQWVKNENAWVVPFPERDYLALLDQLRGYQLDQQVLRYCSRAQILDCVGEMFNPQRAGNFSMIASESNVRDMLLESVESFSEK